MVQRQRDARLLRTLLKTNSRARLREIVELLLQDLGQPVEGPTARKKDFQPTPKKERAEPADPRPIVNGMAQEVIREAVRDIAACEALARTMGRADDREALLTPERAALETIARLLDVALEQLTELAPIQDEEEAPSG